MIRKNNDKRKRGKDKAKDHFKRNGKYTSKSIRKKESITTTTFASTTANSGDTTRKKSKDT